MNCRPTASSFFNVITQVALACWIVGLLGCGSNGPSRIALSGKATRGGQPIRQGSITLTPNPGQKGVAANTSITNGVYRFTSEDGPSPGAYRAIIQEVVTKEEILKRPSVSGIPATQWELEVKVPESGSTSVDFAVD
ncbi:MAG: hypothetical protein NT013_13115 [Planctomycetia bacterium]|nr:hypothetical protein [Planctomycetia bacterium]